MKQQKMKSENKRLSKGMLSQKKMGVLLMALSILLAGVCIAMGIMDGTAAVVLFPLGLFLTVSRHLWIYTDEEEKPVRRQKAIPFPGNDPHGVSAALSRHTA